ncbi:unnamed protein product, partial [Penicillium nalgiovense]
DYLGGGLSLVALASCFFLFCLFFFLVLFFFVFGEDGVFFFFWSLFVLFLFLFCFSFFRSTVQFGRGFRWEPWDLSDSIPFCTGVILMSTTRRWGLDCKLHCGNTSNLVRQNARTGFCLLLF